MRIRKFFNYGAFAVCLFFSNSIFSQTDYFWDYYKIAVTLPSDFKELLDTDNEFEAKGDGMHLYIYIFDDHKVSLKDMNDETKKVAKQLKFDITDETTEISDDEFQGRYVLGYKSGSQIMLAGMIQKNNDTNLWIAIEFADGDKEAEREGLRIINSLRTIK